MMDFLHNHSFMKKEITKKKYNTVAKQQRVGQTDNVIHKVITLSYCCLESFYKLLNYRLNFVAFFFFISPLHLGSVFV